MVAWIAVEAGVSAGFLIGDYIYHRITDKPDKPKELKQFATPTVEEGSTIPMIYGRCRVRTPILAWHGKSRAETGSALNDSESAAFIYTMDQFYVCGLAMNSGHATSSVVGMWAGDVKFSWNVDVSGAVITEAPRSTDETTSTVISILHGGLAEILDGNSTQELTDSGGTAVTNIAGRMLTDSVTAIAGDEVPGYRGFISVGLYGNGASRWSMGSNSTLPAYSFEVSSYVSDSGYPGVGTYAQIGQDLNPANAIYDLLVAKHGKAGIEPSLYIDGDSFGNAAATLKSESHGYSRCIDRGASLDDLIGEILEQIDAVLYADETDRKYKLKLIRSDYSLRDIPNITKDNCKDLVNFAMSGWTNLVNKIRVVYTNRSRDYNDDSAVAFNTANGADGIVTEQTISMPGVCYQSLAEALARRELAARSRPLMKCRALCDRSFIRVCPGDVVKVTWSGPDIAGMVFRVVAVDRGTLDSGYVTLDLIQDYSYIYRQISPQPPGLGPRPPAPGLTLG